MSVKNESQNPSETVGQNYEFTIEQTLLNNYPIKKGQPLYHLCDL